MTVPTDDQLDDLAAALIPRLQACADAWAELPEARETRQRRHRRRDLESQLAGLRQEAQGHATELGNLAAAIGAVYRRATQIVAELRELVA